MYGLVNKAIKDLIISEFGEDTWKTIRTTAQVPVDSFVSMESYSDDITHKLVAAASDVLDMSTDEVLEAFGRYWTTYTARQGYGHYLRMAGNNLAEFLANLDMLHGRVSLSFAGLAPPSFEVSDVTERGLRLHYFSHRAGLAPLVKGLLEGLGELFNTAIEVHHDRVRGTGNNADNAIDHDEFVITYLTS
ncbi:MAG: heme NO-binding domain-containing protein [Proteobacteria bacterium]|nr:heme NO-binding domain-containing protein [Pseudomonadota bacterium]